MQNFSSFKLRSNSTRTRQVVTAYVATGPEAVVAHLEAMHNPETYINPHWARVSFRAPKNLVDPSQTH